MRVMVTGSPGYTRSAPARRSLEGGQGVPWINHRNALIASGDLGADLRRTPAPVETRA